MPPSRRRAHTACSRAWSDELGAHADRRPPSQDAVGVGVDDERDLDHPGPARNIGQARDAQGVRAGRVEPELQGSDGRCAIGSAIVVFHFLRARPLQSSRPTRTGLQSEPDLLSRTPAVNADAASRIPHMREVVPHSPTNDYQYASPDRHSQNCSRTAPELLQNCGTYATNR